ncbi:MAG: AraC family transcriptional regulator [Pseudomonadota bacterium]
MDISMLTEAALRQTTDPSHTGIPVDTKLPNLMFIRQDQPTPFQPMIYDAVVCLTLQGAKETTNGSHSVFFSSGQSLIVSHDLTVMARVTQATRRAPYLALILRLDLTLLRGLYDRVGGGAQDDPGCALAVGGMDPPLADALARYVALLDDPTGAEVLGPLVLQEIHYRLLMAPNGCMLRRLLDRDSNPSRIARAIARLRQDYRQALPVSILAGAAGMSASSFHEHFKQITGTTPLQYQKNLRLIEARRLLAGADQGVSQVAFDVGYESPAQFSREYARKFGVPPSHHLAYPLSAVAEPVG